MSRTGTTSGSAVRTSMFLGLVLDVFSEGGVYGRAKHLGFAPQAGGIAADGGVGWWRAGGVSGCRRCACSRGCAWGSGGVAAMRRGVGVGVRVGGPGAWLTWGFTPGCAILVLRTIRASHVGVVVVGLSACRRCVCRADAVGAPARGIGGGPTRGCRPGLWRWSLSATSCYQGWFVLDWGGRCCVGFERLAWSSLYDQPLPARQWGLGTWGLGDWGLGTGG